MPTTTAVLKRTRCSARSKRSGRRCENYCRPGAAVCWAHGGKRQRTQAAAERRELIAELLAADPRPVRLVLRDAVTVSDAIMQDVRAEVQAGTVSPELIARQHGEALARTLRVLIAPLMPRFTAGPQDARALAEWLRAAVPIALRGQPVPEPPSTWRMSHFPVLESGEMRRRRERTAEAAFMREAEGAVADGLAPREDGRPGRRASHGQVITPGTVTTSSPLGQRLVRDDVTPTLDDLRAGRSPNAWRGSSPLTERIGEP